MANVPNGQLILTYALGFINAPYRWGGAGPAWDCSGFVLELMKAQGMVSFNYDATADTLFKRTMSGGVPKPETHALSFYGRNGVATHVGYCISDSMIIEAAGGDSKTTSLEAAQSQGAFIRIRPVLFRKDWLGCNVPSKSHFS
jgi:cell wall-associated NlpC family hydrolase